MFKKLFTVILSHKIIVGVVIIAIAAVGYYEYKNLKGKTREVRYVTAVVEKGTFISSVSGSGQVSASNQFDVKAKSSSDVIYVGVAAGQEVKKGTLLVQLDAQEAQKAVRDAKTNLESAKLALEKLKTPADELSILQAENSLTQAKDTLTKLKLSQEIDYKKAQESKQNAESDLAKAYDDGFNKIANAFLDLPTIMVGLQDILFSYNYNQNQQNIYYYADAVQKYDEKALQYRDDANTKYQTSRQLYDQNFQDYKSTSRYSETDIIEELIEQTYQTTKSIAEAIKSTNNLILFYKDKLIEYGFKPQTLADTHLSSLNTYTGKTNSNLSDLLAIKNSIQNDKETIANVQRDLQEMDQNHPLNIAAAEATIKEKEASLAKLKAGPDLLDIQSQELTIIQRRNALLDAEEKLANYYIRAPFDSVVAKMDIKKGDSVSVGATVATLITKQRIAEISLNEVDVAKVKIGQKATITFDAVPDSSITGEVTEIDTIGTVSQGVVYYTVKIVFDTQDERIKPGMSVSATIITDSKVDVLLVPNSAVKQQNGTSYVEVMIKNMLEKRSVETGLANDTVTEIISGLKEGEKVVTQTITATPPQKKTQGGSLRIPGFGGGFGPR